MGWSIKRQGLAFGLEPGDHLLGVHPQLDDLEGHPPADRRALFGRPDRAEPAFAQLLEELVTADERAGFLGELHFLDCRRRGLRGAVFRQKLRLPLVRGEQCFEARAQRGIVITHGIQKNGALVCWLLQRQIEECLFAGRVHGCLISAFSVFSFASPAAIASQDGARQMRTVASPLPVKMARPSADQVRH